jgi:diguanylate cyclase (GGDEF)-like protein/PAS domain S-box-containing protein
MQTIVIGLMFSVLPTLVVAKEAGQTETINVQLKWFHQFQFAGYYAAVEQGFYAEENLNVVLHELDTEKTVVDKVLDGETEYAVGDSGIIQSYAQGAPIVALAAIFQHDPLVFLSRKGSGIISPYEMKGRRLMFDAEGGDEAPLRAMLSGAGLKERDYTYIKHTYNNDDFIAGKIDVMSAYMTDQPFYFGERGVDVNIINPQNYGYDFYGDILFTSQQEVNEHAERVERFLRATIKGWQYALAHPDELIHIIKEQYHSPLSIAHLSFEAKESRKLILPDLIPIGDIQVDRMRRAANVYSHLSHVPTLSDTELEKFFYKNNLKLTLSHEEEQWLRAHPVIRLGIDRDFAPYEWIDGTNHYNGLIADYMRLIEAKLGIKFDIIKDKSWSEVLELAEQGQIDMIAAAVKTPKRSSYLDFTEKYIGNPAVIVSKSADGFVGTLQRLTNKQVVVEKGYFISELLERDYPSIQLIQANNVREALEMVQLGQADAYVGDVFSTSYALKKGAFDALRVAGLTDYESAHSIAVIKEHTMLLSIMNKVLSSITPEQKETIQDYWMASSPAAVVSVRAVIKYAIWVLAVFLIGIYWVYRLHREISTRKQIEIELQTILDTEPECVKVVDHQGRLVRMNRAGLMMLGSLESPESIMGQDIRMAVANEDRGAYESMMAQVFAGNKVNLDYKIQNLKGEMSWVTSYSVPYNDPKTGRTEMLSLTRDISDIKKAEEELRLSHRVFMNTHEGIMITDRQSVITDVNPAFSDITGYARDEIIGQTPAILNSGKQSPEYFEDMWSTLETKGSWQGEIWNRTKEGALIAELLSISTLKDDNGQVQHYVGIFSDITHNKRQQEQLNLLAHYDVLTGLPNRVLFTDRFNRAIAHSKRTQRALAVCFLDLDNFKPVNDNYGHEKGDELLIEVAKRIQEIIREEDTVSRQGGDEFALLLNDIVSTAECEQILTRLLVSLAQPYVIDGLPHKISASIGVTFYPEDDADIDTLLRHADQAMYQAKLAGRNRYQLFDNQYDKTLTTQQLRLDEIKQALENDEFELFYQPKVDMAQGKVIGAEALIRWMHPEKGLIPPLDFLPLLDGTSLECELGDWVIETALHQLDEWLVQNIELQLSVNIASHHLQQHNFVQSLEAALARHPKVHSTQFQLEILETSALTDLQSIHATIRTCQEALGVSFALDDFGTGYSSLTHLRTLSANCIKIDQTFVRDILDDPNDYVIVDGVIGLSESFNRDVIAEGVETEEQGLMLLIMGCRLAQGYGVAKPMPVAAFNTWLSGYQPNQAWLAAQQQITSERDKDKKRLSLTLQQWRNRFESRVLADINEDKQWPIMNGRKCHCGIWLREAKDKALYNEQKLAELTRQHKVIHDVADMIHDQYLTGQIEMAKSQLAELTQACQDMLQTLCDE